MSVASLKRVPMETPCVQLLADLRRGELWPRHQCSIWLPGPAVGLIKHLLPHLTLLQHCQIPTEGFLQKTTVVMKATKSIPVSRLLTVWLSTFTWFNAVNNPITNPITQ